MRNRLVACVVVGGEGLQESGRSKGKLVVGVHTEVTVDLADGDAARRREARHRRGRREGGGFPCLGLGPWGRSASQPEMGSEIQLIRRQQRTADSGGVARRVAGSEAAGGGCRDWRGGGRRGGADLLDWELINPWGHRVRRTDGTDTASTSIQRLRGVARASSCVLEFEKETSLCFFAPLLPPVGLTDHRRRAPAAARRARPY